MRPIRATVNVSGHGLDKVRSATKQDVLTDRVHTQGLSNADALSASFAKRFGASPGPEVLVSGPKMTQEISYFANKYERDPSPIDNPKKQAYMLG